MKWRNKWSRISDLTLRLFRSWTVKTCPGFSGRPPSCRAPCRGSLWSSTRMTCSMESTSDSSRCSGPSKHSPPSSIVRGLVMTCDRMYQHFFYMSTYPCKEWVKDDTAVFSTCGGWLSTGTTVMLKQMPGTVLPRWLVTERIIWMYWG